MNKQGSEKSIRNFKWMVLGLLCMLSVLMTQARTVRAEGEIQLAVENGQDITQAFQDAVNNYDTVVIPPGAYNCYGVKVNNKSSLTIVADGVTIVQCGGENPLLYSPNGSSVSNLTVIGGTWNANNADLPAMRFYGSTVNVVLSNVTVMNSQNAGIRFKDGSDVRLEGVVSSNNAGYGVIFENQNNILIKNSAFTFSSSGINLSGCHGNIEVSACTMSGNSGNGIVATDCPVVSISDCEITKNSTGIRMSGISERVSLSRNNVLENEKFGIRIFDCQGDVAFSRNYAYDNGGTGISLENCARSVSIYKSNAKRNKDCGIVVVKCANVMVKGCTSTHNTNFGYSFDGNYAAGSTSYCVNLKTSVASSNGKIGIRVVNCGKSNIQETTAESNQEAGVYSQDCESMILNQVSSNKNKSNGASLNTTTVVNAANNSFDSNASNGLRVSGSSSVKVTNGIYSNNSEAGVSLQSTDKLSVKGTKLANNTGYGLNIDTVTTSGLVKNVEAYGNGNIGIRCKGVQGKMNTQDSNVHDNAGSGLYGAECANFVLNGVISDKNGQFGINATDCAIANVKYCEANSNKDIGIRYSGCAKVIVTESSADKNVNAGIYAGDCTTLTFNQLSASNNTGFGINVNNGTAVSTVGAKANNNSDVGLRYNQCKRVKVSGCVSDGNGMGILGGNISGYMTIEKCSVDKNASFGINVNDSNKVTFTDCFATGNGDCGLRASKSTNVNVTGGECTTNTNSGILLTGCTDIKVASINVNQNNGYGVSVSGTLGSNVIKQIQTFANLISGIFVSEGSSVRIEDCVSKDNGAHGVYVLDSKATLNNVQSESNYWNGLSVSGSASKVVVNQGLYISNGTRPDQYEDDDNLCAGIGIYEGASATINETECIKNHGCGITAAGSKDGKLVSKIAVYGCIADSNGDHGIGGRPYAKINVCASVTGAGTQITNNKFSGFIINDHCSSDYVRDCVISGNGKHGISVSESSKIKLAENNQITQNKEDGVHVSDKSSLEIRNCVIEKNVLSGIGVYSSSTMTAGSCEIYENKHYGVCIDMSTAPALEQLTIGSNEWAGVIVRGNKGRVESLKDCEIKGNKTYGLYCSEGGFFKAENIKSHENVNDGIRVTGSGSEGQIAGAEVNKNQQNGIIVKDGGKLSALSDLVIANNLKHGLAIYKDCTVVKPTGTFKTKNNGNKQIYVEAGANTSLVTK